MGDKYYKLADAFYGDSRDWWVIAKFNQKPTESHVKIGDIILIPKPLSVILNYLRG
jgi:nucleoid-associated protein YgaU